MVGNAGAGIFGLWPDKVARTRNRPWADAIAIGSFYTYPGIYSRLSNDLSVRRNCQVRVMDIFGKTEKYIAIVLLVLMGIVVIAAAAEIAF